MKFKVIKDLFGELYVANIFVGNTLVYYEDILKFVPSELDNKEVRTIIPSNHKIDVYLERE